MPDNTRTSGQIEAELADVDQALAGKDADAVTSTGQPPSAEEAAIEKEAGRHGWVPKEHFKGDPAKWKPAQQYVDEGLRFNRNIKRELDQLREQFKEQERVGQAFAKFHEEAMARKDAEIAQAIKETKQRARQAVREGDDDLAETLEDRVELLKEEREGLKAQTKVVQAEERAVKQPDGAINPVVKEWIADGNEWFDADPELRQYALDVGNEMRASGETAQGRRMLDLVAARVREDFPRRFNKKAPTERRNDQVETDAGAGPAGGYTIHDLPAEDLALMKEFISKGWTTKDKFLKNYFSSEKKVHRG